MWDMWQGTGFPHSTSGFPYQSQSTEAPYWCYITLATDGVVKQTNTQSQYDRNVPNRVTTTPAVRSDECKGAFHGAHAFEISSRSHCTVRPGTTDIYWTIQIHFIPHRKHYVPIPKGNIFQSFRETVVIHSDNHMERTNTYFGQNARLILTGDNIAMCFKGSVLLLWNMKVKRPIQQPTAVTSTWPVPIHVPKPICPSVWSTDLHSVVWSTEWGIFRAAKTSNPPAIVQFICLSLSRSATTIPPPSTLVQSVLNTTKRQRDYLGVTARSLRQSEGHKVLQQVVPQIRWTHS